MGCDGRLVTQCFFGGFGVFFWCVLSVRFPLVVDCRFFGSGSNVALAWLGLGLEHLACAVITYRVLPKKGSFVGGGKSLGF